MINNLLDDIINTYNTVFINKEINRINKLEFGYVENNCKTRFIPIIIHCYENYDLFNKEQKANINFIINNIL